MEAKGSKELSYLQELYQTGMAAPGEVKVAKETGKKIDQFLTRLFLTPLRFAKYGVEEGVKARQQAGLIRGGPRSETGEWTQEQLDAGLAQLAFAAEAISGGAAGGAPAGDLTALGIGLPQAKRMVAKDWKRRVASMVGRTKRHGPKTYEKLIRPHIRREAATTREYIKALEEIPQKFLDPIESVNLYGEVEADKILKGARGTYTPTEYAVRFSIEAGPEEALNVALHEIAGHGRQFAKHRDFIESLGPKKEERYERLLGLWEMMGSEAFPKEFSGSYKPALEAHAYEFGDVAEAAIKLLRKKGRKITEDELERIYEKTKRTAELKFGPKPPRSALEDIKTKSFARRERFRKALASQGGLMGRAERAMSSKKLTEDAIQLGRELHTGKVKLSEIAKMSKQLDSELKKALKIGDFERYSELAFKNQYFNEAREFAEILAGSTKYPGKVEIFKRSGYLPKGF